jgi:hypothetical protein
MGFSRTLAFFPWLPDDARVAWWAGNGGSLSVVDLNERMAIDFTPNRWIGGPHEQAEPRRRASPRPVDDSRRGHLRQLRGSSWRTRLKWPLRASRTSSVIQRAEASIVVRKWRPPQTRAFAVS